MRQIFLSHKFLRRRLDLFVYLLFFFLVKTECRKEEMEKKEFSSRLA